MFRLSNRGMRLIAYIDSWYPPTYRQWKFCAVSVTFKKSEIMPRQAYLKQDVYMCIKHLIIMGAW